MAASPEQFLPQISEVQARRNFCRMSLCIAMAEGCLTAILAVSAALVGGELFSLAAGTMFCAYVFGALLAPYIIDRLGLRRSLNFGLLSTCLYALAFLSRSARALVPGAVLNGVGAAMMWTAQGAYMTRASDIIGGPNTLKQLSGIFAVAFPLSLTFCKLSSSLVLWLAGSEWGVPIVYGIYVLLSLAAFLVSLTLRELPLVTAEPRVYSTGELLLATAQLLGDPIMLLMVPTNMAFGFVTGFFPTIVTVTVGQAHGEQCLGLLYAIAGLSGAAWSPLCSWLTTTLKGGVSLVMVAGACCFAATCASTFLSSFMEWPFLIGAFILYGGGQSVWQGPTMALFGAYWPCNPQAAYANLKLHSGVASTLAFFLFPHVHVTTSALCCLVTVALGLLGYLLTACLTAGYDRRRCCHQIPNCICKDCHKKETIICSECQNPMMTRAFLGRADSTQLVARSEDLPYFRPRGRSSAPSRSLSEPLEESRHARAQTA